MLRWQCPACAAVQTDSSLISGSGPGRCADCAREFPRRDGVWRLADDFRPDRFPLQRHHSLAAMGDDHFWLGARRQLVATLLKRFLAESGMAEPPTILDLGCGSGAVMAALAKSFDARWVGVEGHPEPLELAARRLPDATWIHVDGGRLPFAPGQFDAVLLLDVLEHMDPIPLLNEVFRVAKPGAMALITVPAGRLLWSRMDELAGHRCRYDRFMLKQEMDVTGWTIVHRTHYQFLLWPLVYLTRRLGRRREQAVERRPPKLLNAALGAINRLEVSRLGGRQLPWGSSLVTVGRRP